MDNYVKNRFCGCMRCKMNSMMGPVMLVTLGVLFLMENYHLTRGSTFAAVLLIVIGGVKMLQSSASTEGHRQPYPYADAVPPQPSSTATENTQVNNNG